MASAKQKQAMLAKELANQPAKAADNDNVEAAAPTVAEVQTGTIRDFLEGKSDENLSHDERLKRDHSMDAEIVAAEKRLRALKMRRAGQQNIKLKPGQELFISEKDGRAYIRETLVGEKGATITRKSCVEYEPN